MLGNADQIVPAIPSHRSPLCPSCAGRTSNKLVGAAVLRCWVPRSIQPRLQPPARTLLSDAERPGIPGNVLMDWRATNFSGMNVTNVGSFYDSWSCRRICVESQVHHILRLLWFFRFLLLLRCFLEQNNMNFKQTQTCSQGFSDIFTTRKVH